MSEHDSVKLRLGGLLFSWDDKKAIENLKKHNVSFVVASSVFLDSQALIDFNMEDNKEDRFNIIGTAISGVLFVVFVERVNFKKQNIIRLISARRATKKEVKRYVDKFR